MKKTVCILCILALLITGCAKSSTETFFAMDTFMQLSINGKDADSAVSEIKEAVNGLEALLSVTDENSEISRINRGDTVSVSADTLDIIRRAIEISKLTDGAFDISIYPVVSLWGFTSETNRVPSEEEIHNALQNVGYENIKVNGNSVSTSAMIDLGGIAKGYATSKAREILEKYGVESAVLSMGGNALVYGDREFNVGIQHPKKSDGIIATLKAKNKSVVTSGGYQRYFEQNGEKYHHIIDTESGYPAKSGIISATVITEDDTLADALATALYVMGIDKATEFWKENRSFDMLLITDNDVYTTTEIELKDQDFKLNIIE